MRKKGLKLLLLSILLSNSLYALTKTEISMLYVAILNRASEGEGNEYWQTSQPDMATTANAILNTDDAKAYFGTRLDTNKAFIEWIYKNTLNKTESDDPDGIAYWVNQLDSGKSKGEVVATLVNAALDPVNAGNAQKQFKNRVEVSNYMADTVEKAPSDYATSTSFSSGLTVTSDSTSVNSAKESVNLIATGSSGNIAPTVNAGEDKTVTVNQTVTLVGTATDNDGTIVSYEWKKGDIVLGTSATLIYTSTEVGTDTLTLTVIDDDGAIGSDSVKIIIEEETIIDTPSIKK